MAKSHSGMGTAVNFGNGGRAEQAGKRHVGKSRTATQWRQDFKVGQELMSREEQGWVQVTAGMSRTGEGDGTDSPHRKATRARGGSNTEEDGYCGAGQAGNIRKSRIGQQRRARRCSGVANKKIGTAREEEIDGNIGGKELVRAVLCEIMIIIVGKARRTKSRGRCN